MMDEVIKRLEAATKGSRELDCRIAAAINVGQSAQLVKYTTGPTSEQTSWAVVTGKYSHSHYFPKHFTTSIDAALTLMPKFWRMSISDAEYGDDPQDVLVQLWPNEAEIDFSIMERDGEVEAQHLDRIMALCIAALKARQSGASS